jgi:hypothetical protein
LENFFTADERRGLFGSLATGRLVGVEANIRVAIGRFDILL